MTMTLVETVTVGSGGASSIEFTSIPQDADDLLLVVSARSGVAATRTGIAMTFNNDTTTSYVRRALVGDGTTATSNNLTFSNLNFNNAIPGTDMTASTFNNASFYIPNYAASTAKSVSAEAVVENNGTEGYQNIFAGSYTVASAITSIKMTVPNNFIEHSTASLYKITKA